MLSCSVKCACCQQVWEPKSNFDNKSGRRIKGCKLLPVACCLHGPERKFNAHDNCQRKIVEVVHRYDRLAVVVPEARCISSDRAARTSGGCFRVGWDVAVDILVVLSSNQILAIEVDGLSHDRTNAKARDAKKEVSLMRKSIELIRLDIRSSVQEVESKMIQIMRQCT